MAKRFWISDAGGHNVVPTVRFQTDAGDGVMDPGMLLKLKANGSPYVTPLVDGDHTIGTDTAIVGLAASTATHTSTADGYVDVYMPLPGVIYEGYATTAANVDTDSELNALLGDRVTIDVAGTTATDDWTVDEDAGEAQTNAFQLVGGDSSKQTLKFIIRSGATYLGDQDLA